MAELQIKPFYSGRMAYDITAPDGSKYVFVPKEFAEKGFVQDGYQYFEPAFMNKEAFANAAAFTLPSLDSFTEQAKSLYSKPNEGYVWKAEDFNKLNTDNFSFEGYQITANAPAITGLGVKDDKNIYITAPSEGQNQTFISDFNSSDGVVFQNLKITPGSKRGLFGNNFISDAFADVGNLILDAGPIGTLALNAVMPGLGTAVAVGSQIGQGNLEGAAASFVAGNALQNVLPSTGSAITDAAINSGATAALTGGNVLQSAVLGGANAGLSGSLQDVRGANSPDYYDFEPDSFPDTTKPDYDFKADYSLTSGVSTPYEGFQAPRMAGDVFNADGSVDYSLNVPAQNMGFKYTGIPSLPEMGGGQGLVANVPGGTVSQTGFIPTNPSPVIGDPNSFINKEGGTGVVDSVDYGKLLEALLSSGFGAAAMQAARGGQETAPQPLTPFQPQNTMPVYDDAYFNAIQQNYNALAPTGLMADVATPLREWYVPEQSVVDRLFGDKI